MKNPLIILFPGLVFCVMLFSCESENLVDADDPEFKVEFSDGTVISERDLAFYDSSTHLLFLNKDFALGQDFSGFSVLVNNDTVYNGIIYPCLLSAPPSESFFIPDCYSYGNHIVELGYYSYTKDLRNDQQIIDALERSNLLHHGLSCRIKNINVTPYDDYAEVVYAVTIKNNDNFDYYIPDPEKMGESDFNYYTGGLFFGNLDTHVSSFLKWSIPNPDWNNITFHDLSVLAHGSEVTYTVRSADYYKMEKGIYSALFRFSGIKNVTTSFGLNPFNRRVWIGDVEASIDSVIVE